MPVLTEYRKKRTFAKTEEPRGKKKHSKGKLVFVVQQHAASHLHYDFRLEMEGVLKSWAVPKGPSLDPDDKRLAMMVEDHPYDYKDFEGTIPEGNYGAGNVIVWDNGTYEPLEGEDEKSLLAGLHKGKISFIMHGHKLKGEFALVKMHPSTSSGRSENTWLLIKKNDKYASKEDVLKKNRSVKTRRTLVQLEKLSGIKRRGSSRTKPGALKRRQASTVKTGSKAALPPKKKELERIRPMLAEIGDKPFDNEHWIFEFKYDGYRAVANISGGSVDLYSRNLNPFNASYPQIVNELSKISHQVILDGEVVAEDEEGRSAFQLLQNNGNSAAALKYYVFDLLHLNGYDLYQVPLVNRKELLKNLLGQFQLENIFYSEHVERDGIAFYERAKKLRHEGIIAKDSRSPYRPGSRTKEWLKIKIHRQQETVIVGFTAPRGSRKFFGSLVLAVRQGNEWIYTGNCGTGFSEQGLKALYETAKPYFTDRSPFSMKVNAGSEVQWLKPHLVCEVKFSEWTSDGSMRHPVFLGLRNDKKATEVIREKPTVHTSGKNAPAKKQVVKISRKRKEKKVHQNEVKGEPVHFGPASIPPKNAGQKEFDVKAGRTTLHLTNQDKIYWPKEGYRKSDLLAYYDLMAPVILPYLKDRPQSMNRFPNGIEHESFYQKDVGHSKIPDWVKTEKVFSESNNAYIEYLLCNDKATLLYMANLGCIEINPWNSRIKKPEYPDWVVIDLDPEEIGFKEVVRAALTVKEVLDELEVHSYPKTSGATGLHIYIPLGAKYDYDAAKNFAELIAHLVNTRLPETTSVLRMPAKRKHKVYLDFLQNRRGQTLAAPYSLRPKPGATVSTPLRWDEVNDELDPTQFTIKTIFKRLEKMGDIWTPVVGKGEDIQRVLKKLRDVEF